MLDRKKNVVYTVIISMVMVVILFMSGLSLYSLKKTLFLTGINTTEKSKNYLKANGVNVEEVISNINKKSMKFVVKSKHNYNIPVEYILSNGTYDNMTMVLVHGHGMDKVSMYPIADTLVKNKINVVLYDQRLHGENTAKYITFGYYEKDDLEDVINFVKTNMSRKNKIGALGQSMGASTLGIYTGTEHAKNNLDFAILDCPYNNMKSIVYRTGKRQGFSGKALDPLIFLGDIGARIFFGFSYNDVDVVKSISNSAIPTLLYNVKNDETCPYYMADEVYDGIKHNNKEKIQFESCGHINGFYKNNDIYMESLLKFVSKYK